jgi:hypothetical protein
VLYVDAWEIVSAVSAAGSAVAAGLAWRAARQSNRTAETLARIETERCHAELTPVLKVRCDEKGGVTSQRLTVTFTGPPGLDGIDALTVAITDDSEDRARNRFQGGPSAEKIQEIVWGPVRFMPDSGPGEDRADGPAGQSGGRSGYAPAPHWNTFSSRPSPRAGSEARVSTPGGPSSARSCGWSSPRRAPGTSHGRSPANLRSAPSSLTEKARLRRSCRCGRDRLPLIAQRRLCWLPQPNPSCPGSSD